MPWLRIDDGFGDHSKVIDLSDAAFRLHVLCLCHCARQLTDGYVSEQAARRAYPRSTASAIRELLSARLWTRTGGGYLIHDYLQYNPSRERVMADRAAARDRMKDARSHDVRANVTRTSEEPNLPRTRTPVPKGTGTTRRGEIRPIGEAAARVVEGLR